MYEKELEGIVKIGAALYGGRGVIIISIRHSRTQTSLNIPIHYVPTGMICLWKTGVY